MMTRVSLVIRREIRPASAAGPRPDSRKGLMAITTVETGRRLALASDPYRSPTRSWPARVDGRVVRVLTSDNDCG
jgi:hypothetical protein